MTATETKPRHTMTTTDTKEGAYGPYPAETPAAAMDAVVQRRYGGPEVLALETVARPEPGPGEVRLRVHAAAVQQGDWHLLTGLPYLIRAAFGVTRPRRRIPGQDVAGIVDAVGTDVTRLQVGDAVYGSAIGGYAEYLCADEKCFAPMPKGVSFSEAAAIPHGGYTALQALRDVASIAKGQRVLILGGSGAVGSMAVQIAKQMGGEVTAVCSTRHVASVRALGADRVIDYTRESFTTDSTRYDAIIDTAAREPLRHYRRALTTRGRVVMVGAGQDRWLGGMGRMLRAVVGSIFRRQKFRSLLALPSRDDFEVLNGWIEAGLLSPQLGRTFPLSEIADAFRLLERRTIWGRIVVTPSDLNETESPA